MTQSQEFGRQFSFNEIFQAEIDVINQRRASHRNPLRPDIVLTNKIKSTSDDPLHPDVVTEAEQTDSTGTPVLFPAENANLTGLALSGGGIRSAAFCLGALQALNEARVLERIDYLSTVSGGGYIGCSLSAALEKSDPPGQFPFGVNDVEDETPSMQHVRDYSNYLFPNGATDVLDNLAIYVRGLVANFILIMPIILFAAVLTILFNPTIHSLIEPDFAGYKLRNFLGLPVFSADDLFGGSAVRHRGDLGTDPFGAPQAERPGNQRPASQQKLDILLQQRAQVRGRRGGRGRHLRAVRIPVACACTRCSSIRTSHCCPCRSPGSTKSSWCWHHSAPPSGFSGASSPSSSRQARNRVRRVRRSPALRRKLRSISRPLSFRFCCGLSI